MAHKRNVKLSYKSKYSELKHEKLTKFGRMNLSKLNLFPKQRLSPNMVLGHFATRNATGMQPVAKRIWRSVPATVSLFFKFFLIFLIINFLALRINIKGKK